MVGRKLRLTVVGRGLAFLPSASPDRNFGFSTVGCKLRPTVVGRGLAFAKGTIKGANIHLRPLFAPFAKAGIARN
jgi:hypothetical protein